MFIFEFGICILYKIEPNLNLSFSQISILIIFCEKNHYILNKFIKNDFFFHLNFKTLHFPINNVYKFEIQKIIIYAFEKEVFEKI